MALFPPPEADREFVASLAPLGVLGGPETYLNPEPALVDALTEGAAEGQGAIRALATSGNVEPVNGWLQALHSFDYNLARLGLGTIDDPAWKVGDRFESYAVRAATALGGLWGVTGTRRITRSSSSTTVGTGSPVSTPIRSASIPLHRLTHSGR